MKKGPWHEIHKRFSDFEKLRSSAIEERSELFLPALPEKVFSANLNLHDEELILKRRNQLEIFLNKLLSHSQIPELSVFKLFLQQVTNLISRIYFRSGGVDITSKKSRCLLVRRDLKAILSIEG